MTMPSFLPAPPPSRPPSTAAEAVAGPAVVPGGTDGPATVVRRARPRSPMPSRPAQRRRGHRVRRRCADRRGGAPRRRGGRRVPAATASGGSGGTGQRLRERVTRGPAAGAGGGSTGLCVGHDVGRWHHPHLHRAGRGRRRGGGRGNNTKGCGNAPPVAPAGPAAARAPLAAPEARPVAAGWSAGGNGAWPVRRTPATLAAPEWGGERGRRWQLRRRAAPSPVPAAAAAVAPAALAATTRCDGGTVGTGGANDTGGGGGLGINGGGAAGSNSGVGTGGTGGSTTSGERQRDEHRRRRRWRRATRAAAEAAPRTAAAPTFRERAAAAVLQAGAPRRPRADPIERGCHRNLLRRALPRAPATARAGTGATTPAAGNVGCAVAWPRPISPGRCRGIPTNRVLSTTPSARPRARPPTPPQVLRRATVLLPTVSSPWRRVPCRPA